MQLVLDARFAPHRYGPYRLPTPPLETAVVECSALLDNVQTFLQQVDEVCIAAGIPIAYRTFACRHHWGHEPSESPITFLLVAHIADREPEAVRSLLADVQRLCLTAGAQVGVEVVDPPYYGRKSFAVRATDGNAVQNWDELSSRVLHFLDTTARDHGCFWRTMDLFRRGASQERDNCAVTLVVGTAESDNPFWWDCGLRHLQALANQNIMVEILHVSSWEAISLIDQNAYQDPVCMGASLTEDVSHFAAYPNHPSRLRHENDVNPYRKGMEDKKSDLDEAQRCNRVIGSLIASSGRRTILAHEFPHPSQPSTQQGNALRFLADWALVGTQPGRSAENKIHKLKVHGRDQERGVTTHLTDGLPSKEYEILRSPSKRTLVAFRGRTSSWGFGEVNGVTTVNSILPGDIAETYNLSESDPGYYWAITQRVYEYHGDVCRPGDSGSVVLLDGERGAGRWVGLLFGAALGVGYM
ncbi:hypothetical protein K458DRAFT_389561 [Lentithecium fluviatile CBS 122367]|uniref:Uncharacterized protein n=1 Tax=Lentithecium fluviatile CBS 122367 TaxID=1168545 RepID=A0A6G1IZX4_9PLEO|nr:hypothetical protein K458DRAFT_389561 [Lentithecium fluviatile CBS 122367]